MSRWMRVGPFTLTGGVSLTGLYMAAFTSSPTGPITGVLMAPRDVRVPSGSREPTEPERRIHQGTQ
jgi:hypothetical protein